MIPIKYIREYLEKDAAVHGEAIKKVYRFVKKHPWTTIGTVGGTVGGLALVDRLARAILPTYHILNEQRKNSIMNDQTGLLQQISSAVNKPNESVEQNPYTITSTQPLA